MRIRHAAAFAASLLLTLPGLAIAQNDPFTGGDYVEVTGISIDDGHYMDYATFIHDTAMKQAAFMQSKGWAISTEYMANVHPRKGEPDLYIVRRYKDIPDSAEGERRAAALRDYMKMDDTQSGAASAERARYRHVDGTLLLQVMKPR